MTVTKVARGDAARDGAIPININWVPIGVVRGRGISNDGSYSRKRKSAGRRTINSQVSAAVSGNPQNDKEGNGRGGWWTHPPLNHPPFFPFHPARFSYSSSLQLPSVFYYITYMRYAESSEADCFLPARILSPPRRCFAICILYYFKRMAHARRAARDLSDSETFTNIRTVSLQSVC